MFTRDDRSLACALRRAYYLCFVWVNLHKFEQKKSFPLMQFSIVRHLLMSFFSPALTAFGDRLLLLYSVVVYVKSPLTFEELFLHINKCYWNFTNIRVTWIISIESYLRNIKAKGFTVSELCSITARVKICERIFTS
jgi:hypothetical protein